MNRKSSSSCIDSNMKMRCPCGSVKKRVFYFVVNRHTCFGTTIYLARQIG